MRWLRVVLTGSLLFGTTSCATSAMTVPPISVAPQRENTDNPQTWFVGLLNAYIDNCVTLSVMRHEDYQRCNQP